MQISPRFAVLNALLALGMIFGMYGCTDLQIHTPVHVTFSPVAEPGHERDFYSVDWLSNDVLIAKLRQPNQSQRDLEASNIFGLVRLDDLSITDVRLIDDKTCARKYFAVRSTFRNEVIYQVQCLTDTYRNYVFTYNVLSGATRQIGEGSLDGERYGDLIRDVSWQPTIKRGIAERENGMCWRISYFSENGTEIPDIVLEDGTLRWNLADEFAPANWADCLNRGTVLAPAWSGDGNTISVFASPDAGKSYLGLGTSRLSARYKLFLMGYPGNLAKPVFGTVYDPGKARWSPDSRYLAFTAATTAMGGWFLWIYDKLTGKMIRVANEELEKFSWSPDSRRILVIRNIKGPDGVERGKLFVFDNPL